jgi:hypothetical protein
MMKYLMCLLFVIGCGPGPQGAQGQAGANGTTISSVQFCPGVPSYPSTFPEVGFCIDNNLYAVYSYNNGFLTLIPPGYYNSNAVGSNCNFTVLPNCQVSN